MSSLVSRKWRQFFKRIPLRTRFTIVLTFVLINLILYFLWNNYQHDFSQTRSRTRDWAVTMDRTRDFINGTEMDDRLVIHRYSVTNNSSQPLCDERSLNLVGRFQPDLTAYHWHVIETKYPLLSQGHWSPPCRTDQRVAIIIPYRNRARHIKVLVNNLHVFLQKQNVDYGIFVVEQIVGTNFNRAMLFNIGFRESLKWYNFNCFVFHDVDLIPENYGNVYRCGDNPRHLSAFIDKFSYKLPYLDLFGGVCAISLSQMLSVNGFSNFYFGWGGEDDDMSKRLRHKGYHIFRYPNMIGAYKMIKHNGDSGNDANTWRFGLVKSAVARMPSDGLNSLNYSVISIEPHKLTVWLKIKVDEERVKRNYSLWINQNFFDADLNYQLRVVIIILLLFIGSLVLLCLVIMCAIKTTPDSFQPLLSNKNVNNEKSNPLTK